MFIESVARGEKGNLEKLLVSFISKMHQFHIKKERFSENSEM